MKKIDKKDNLTYSNPYWLVITLRCQPRKQIKLWNFSVFILTLCKSKPWYGAKKMNLFDTKLFAPKLWNIEIVQIKEGKIFLQQCSSLNNRTNIKWYSYVVWLTEQSFQDKMCIRLISVVFYLTIEMEVIWLLNIS